eukprot:331053-Rhodomonas_salina.2
MRHTDSAQNSGHFVHAFPGLPSSSTLRRAVAAILRSLALFHKFSDRWAGRIELYHNSQLTFNSTRKFRTSVQELLYCAERAGSSAGAVPASNLSLLLSKAPLHRNLPGDQLDPGADLSLGVCHSKIRAAACESRQVGV